LPVVVVVVAGLVVVVVVVVRSLGPVTLRWGRSRSSSVQAAQDRVLDHQSQEAVAATRPSMGCQPSAAAAVVPLAAA